MNDLHDMIIDMMGNVGYLGVISVLGVETFEQVDQFV